MRKKDLSRLIRMRENSPTYRAHYVSVPGRLGKGFTHEIHKLAYLQGVDGYSKILKLDRKIVYLKVNTSSQRTLVVR